MDSTNHNIGCSLDYLRNIPGILKIIELVYRLLFSRYNSKKSCPFLLPSSVIFLAQFWLEPHLSTTVQQEIEASTYSFLFSH